MLLTLLGYYHHNNDGWWIIGIPVVIVLLYLIKILFALIVGGISELLGFLGGLLSGLITVVIGLFKVILRILCSGLVFFVFVGVCAGLLYLIGHQIADWAEGLAIVLGIGLGLWLFFRCSGWINKLLDKISPM